MSRRRHVKPVRQTAVFVGFPKLVEGEDYTLAVILFMGLVFGLVIFIAPAYLHAAPFLALFLIVLWQLYSGVALSGRWRAHPIIAKYKREEEPKLFYATLATWVVAGLVLLASYVIHFLRN